MRFGTRIFLYASHRSVQEWHLRLLGRDGMPDRWEVAHHLDPRVANEDSDRDGADDGDHDDRAGPKVGPKVGPRVGPGVGPKIGLKVRLGSGSRSGWGPGRALDHGVGSSAFRVASQSGRLPASGSAMAMSMPR